MQVIGVPLRWYNGLRVNRFGKFPTQFDRCLSINLNYSVQITHRRLYFKYNQTFKKMMIHIKTR